ncbi:MAG: hypothetical protein ACTSRP_03110 [Candidatus Helarchaeota archaeon]
MASKPKTVFERLEERLEKVEQILDKIIPGIIDQVIPSIEKVKEELPASIGPNLMSFADMIGEQIENLSKTISNAPGGTAGAVSSADSGELMSTINKLLENFNVLLNSFNSLNSKIDNLNNEIISIKNSINEIKSGGIQVGVKPMPTVAPTAAPQPQPAQPTITQPATQIKQGPAPVPSPAPTPTKMPTQAKPAPTAPATTPTTIPTVTAEYTTVPKEVFDLFDSITEKLKSGMLANQLGQYMDEVRDKITNLYKWHPTLYELASHARKLKKLGPEDPVDADTYQLLLEKIQEWKRRIKTG